MSLPTEKNSKMPALFIGHGSPMNAIENNTFSQEWQRLGKTVLPIPKAVLCISAHWETEGTHITAMPKPKTIHDFGGFPEPLYNIQYPAPGMPELASHTQKLVQKTRLGLNHEWGLDHGTWSILRHIYPNADVPVLQLSLDYNKSPRYHYELGQELKKLRDEGILIIGSGNMVHNLRILAWEKIDQVGYGYDWANEISEIYRTKINEGNHNAMIDFEKLSSAASLAIPTPEHYLPLLYVLALQEKNENLTFFNDLVVGGSLSMTSLIIG
jgi:4,5-DOPA dioxygenase extradiol